MSRLLLGTEGGECIAIDLPERPSARPEWFDAPIEISVRGFVGTISTYFEDDDFVRFRESLQSLYEKLEGTAELSHRKG